MDLESRLEVVESENETLREYVCRLEEALCGTVPLPVEWGLTASETLVFGALVNLPIMTKEAAITALYRRFAFDEAEPKIVDVFICKMRKKLDPFGVTIRTRWGQGYELTTEIRDRFRKKAPA
jgi:two-component system cell cycle response regulator CtrA